MSRIKHFTQALKSAMAAFFGVQSSNQHEQDFKSDTPFPFILAGVILLIGFIFILVAIVNAVLATS
jgi:hypothetical protein